MFTINQIQLSTNYKYINKILKVFYLINKFLQ